MCVPKRRGFGPARWLTTKRETTVLGMVEVSPRGEMGTVILLQQGHRESPRRWGIPVERTWASTMVSN
jgi:hypothetical protein